MGNLFKRPKTTDSERKLEERLTRLESLDSNGDGKVSEQEFKAWYNKLNEEQTKKEDTLVCELKLLRQQLANAKSLISKMEVPIETKSDIDKKADLLQLSQERVDEFVQGFVGRPIRKHMGHARCCRASIIHKYI